MKKAIGLIRGLGEILNHGIKIKHAALLGVSCFLIYGIRLIAEEVRITTYLPSPDRVETRNLSVQNHAYLSIAGGQVLAGRSTPINDSLPTGAVEISGNLRTGNAANSPVILGAGSPLPPNGVNDVTGIYSMNGNLYLGSDTQNIIMSTNVTVFGKLTTRSTIWENNETFIENNCQAVPFTCLNTAPCCNGPNEYLTYIPGLYIHSAEWKFDDIWSHFPNNRDVWCCPKP